MTKFKDVAVGQAFRKPGWSQFDEKIQPVKVHGPDGQTAVATYITRINGVAFKAWGAVDDDDDVEVKLGPIT